MLIYSLLKRWGNGWMGCLVNPFQTGVVLAWLAQVLVWTGVLKFYLCKLCLQSTVCLSERHTKGCVWQLLWKGKQAGALWSDTHTTPHAEGDWSRLSLSGNLRAGPGKLEDDSSCETRGAECTRTANVSSRKKKSQAAVCRSSQSQNHTSPGPAAVHGIPVFAWPWLSWTIRDMLQTQCLKYPHTCASSPQRRKLQHPYITGIPSPKTSAFHLNHFHCCWSPPVISDSHVQAPCLPFLCQWVPKASLPFKDFLHLRQTLNP